MTDQQMRDKLEVALGELVYEIRNESTAECSVSRLAEVIWELIETREPKRWRWGPASPPGWTGLG